MSVNAVCVCVLVNAGGYMPLHTRGWGQSPVSDHVFYLVWDRVSFAVTFARLLGPCTSRDSPVCSPFPCRNTGQQTRNGFMSSGLINANPQACKANTSCPEPSPQLKFVFSLFVLYSMYVEITDSRDQAQVLSSVTATQLSYFVHPKFCLISGCFKMIHDP